MNIKQYIELIKNNEVNQDTVADIEKLYGITMPEEIKHIVSVVLDDYFICNNCRILSAKEILSTENFIGIDFAAIKMIPIADCMDDDYIVYNFATQKYELYGAYDEVSFKEADSLEEMIETVE